MISTKRHIFKYFVLQTKQYLNDCLLTHRTRFFKECRNKRVNENCTCTPIKTNALILHNHFFESFVSYTDKVTTLPGKPQRTKSSSLRPDKAPFRPRARECIKLQQAKTPQNLTIRVPYNLKESTGWERRAIMHDSLTLFSFFLLIHANNCVWIHGKSQTVAFCDPFLIFKRKNDFERKHEFLKFWLI